jgi:hypothetical protein
MGLGLIFAFSNPAGLIDKFEPQGGGGGVKKPGKSRQHQL